MKKAVRTQIYVMVAIIALAIALPVGSFALSGPGDEIEGTQVQGIETLTAPDPADVALDEGVDDDGAGGVDEGLPLEEPFVEPAGLVTGTEEDGSPVSTDDLAADDAALSIDEPAEHNVGVVEGIVTDEFGNYVDGILFKLYKVELDGTRTYIGEKYSGPTGYFGTYPAGNVCWSGLPTVDGAEPQTVYELVMHAESPYFATSATAQNGYVSSTNIFGIYTCYWRQFNYTVGIRSMGKIEGYKFADMNLNGIKDDGEPGIAGVTINLDSGAQTTVSGNDGYFSFDVEEGVHHVSEDLSSAPGYFPTTPTLVSVKVTPDAPAVVNFGNVPYGSISGTKYVDNDGDGTVTAGDGTLAGVMIKLDGKTVFGDIVGIEMATDVDGGYNFVNLMPGVYRVTEVVPDGMEAVLPDATIGWNLTLSPGQDVTAQNFLNAYTPLGSISGTKYRDPDKSGALNGDETPIGGVTIKLTGVTDAGGAVNLQATTAIDGTYSFVDLEPGAYNVKEIVPDGMEAVAPPADDGVDVTVTTGQAVADVDFFNADLLTPALIEGYVFIDLDEDGVMDPGETGVYGVTVNLGGDETASTTTDATGYYSFTVTPGSYTVTTPALSPPGEEVVAGYYPTSPTVLTAVVAAGETVRRDYGHAAFGAISGSKHEDLDGNDLYDDGEPAVAGMTVNLTGITNGGESVTLSTITDTTGTYSFSNLKAGSYKVAEEVPVNMLPVTDEEIDVTLVVGESLGGVNFLNVSLGSPPPPDEDGDGDEDEDHGGPVPPPAGPTDTIAGLPTSTATTLPYTGMNQAPITMAAFSIVLFGIALVVLGVRSWRRELGPAGPGVPPIRYWN